MRLPLLLFLFFEVSYSNPTSQVPEGLIQRGSIHNGQIYLNRDVLQKYIKSVFPPSGNISPNQEEEPSTAVVSENTQNQQVYQPPSKYQHVTQYPKKYQWQEGEGALKQQEKSVQQNINHQHVHKRMAEENEYANQNVNQQPQIVPSPSQIVYQPLRHQNVQAPYQRTQQHVAGNPHIRGEQKQEYESQARQNIFEQQMIQQQQQQMLKKQQMEQKTLLVNQQQHQLQLQQQQFHKQQHQQQQHQAQQQQQQMQQYQQQYEQPKNHEPPAYLPINANHRQIQYEKLLQQRQETQQVPQVPEVPPNFQADVMRAFPALPKGVPPYLHQLNLQQRAPASTPHQYAVYPPLQRPARHQPNGGELRQLPFYIGQPARHPPTPPSGKRPEGEPSPAAELQPQQTQVTRTFQSGPPMMVLSQN